MKNIIRFLFTLIISVSSLSFAMQETHSKTLTQTTATPLSADAGALLHTMAASSSSSSERLDTCSLVNPIDQNKNKKSFNKEIYEALQISGIDAGIQKRWPSELPAACWSVILPYLYDMQHEPKKLWFNTTMLNSQLVSYTIFEVAASNMAMGTVRMSRRFNLELNRYNILSTDGTLRLHIESDYNVHVHDVEKNKLIRTFKPVYRRFPLDHLDIVEATISNDNSITGLDEAYCNNQNRCIYDLKTGELIFTTGRMPRVPQLVIVGENEIVEKNLDDQVFMCQKPEIKLTFSQKVFLDLLRQEYADSGKFFGLVAQKTSLPKISKKNEISLQALHNAFAGFNQQVQKGIIKTYNLQTQEDESAGCPIQ